MLKRIIPFVSISAGVIAVFVSLYVYKPSGAQVVPGRVALSATVLIRLFDGNGSLRHFGLVVRAVRRDGSWVQEHQVQQGSPEGMKVVVDALHGRWVAVDPVSKSTTTYEMGGREIDAPFVPRSTCGALGNSGSTDFLGYRVVTDRQHVLVGAEAIDVERLMAPALGCLVMRRSYSATDGGKLTARTVEQVVSVKVGEPDPALFDVPEDYVERPPSAVLVSRLQKEGRQACESCMQSWGDLDRAYLSWQRR